MYYIENKSWNLSEYVKNNKWLKWNVFKTGLLYKKNEPTWFQMVTEEKRPSANDGLQSRPVWIKHEPKRIRFEFTNRCKVKNKLDLLRRNGCRQVGRTTNQQKSKTCEKDE